MIQAQVTKGVGFRITTMVVDEGDQLEFVVPETIDRMTQHNLSVWRQGTWKSTFGDGVETISSGPMLGQDRRREIPPPSVITKCIEGPGIYFCIEPDDANTRWERISLTTLPQDFTVPKGWIVFAGTGVLKKDKKEHDAPVFMYAEQDMQLTKSQDTVGIIGRII